MYYKGKMHRKVFEDQVKRNPCKSSDAYWAAVYLLCADKELWRCAQYIVYKKRINFSALRHKGLGENAYALFKTAQDIFTGTTHLPFRDLCNPYVVSDKVFDLIMTALRIARGRCDIDQIKNTAV
jgi:hypothetical protein